MLVVDESLGQKAYAGSVRCSQPHKSNRGDEMTRSPHLQWNGMCLDDKDRTAGRRHCSTSM